MPIRKLLIYFEKHAAQDDIDEEEESIFHEYMSIQDMHCLMFGNARDLTM